VPGVQRLERGADFREVDARSGQERAQGEVAVGAGVSSAGSLHPKRAPGLEKVFPAPVSPNNTRMLRFSHPVLEFQM